MNLLSQRNKSNSLESVKDEQENRKVIFFLELVLLMKEGKKMAICFFPSVSRISFSSLSVFLLS